MYKFHNIPNFLKIQDILNTVIPQTKLYFIILSILSLVIPC